MPFGQFGQSQDHCDLFFVCEIGITSHLISETPCGPHQYPPLIRKGVLFSHQRFPLQSLDFSFVLLFIRFLAAILDSPFILL